ncbi:hypothetical protein E8L26_08020 [Salmonella enterica]|uniref:Uncharacterized protein n=1 Tax=Salmonella montevideo TaxID=115981 RepID=A0A725MAZ1_SALMO|nr:hypothetical protein [Salmonella enterica]EAO4873771.1 hypothetical protein [Salmonella enterica]EAQ4233671.1 hypothetical protein [Salmonella enterica]EAV6422924.1 hypothetical protein [Salmonella enterica]HAE0881416.1 hypothetical protein [Salmonella enterica subsp. enterica serovar Montevideo]
MMSVRAAIRVKRVWRTLSSCIISPGNFAGWRCAYPLYISCSPVGRIRRSRRHPATKLPRQP